jgi:HPr kinase/phosphorylase
VSAGEQVHATCVALDGHGALIIGASGSGKSDLALRLLMQGAALVADDRVDLRLEDGVVVASPPASLAGLIEVRGLAVVDAAAIGAATSFGCAVRLVVELVPGEQVPRLPGPETRDLLGVMIPLLRLAPFEASASDKLRVALRLAAKDKSSRSG